MLGKTMLKPLSASSLAERSQVGRGKSPGARVVPHGAALARRTPGGQQIRLDQRIVRRLGLLDHAIVSSLGKQVVGTFPIASRARLRYRATAVVRGLTPSRTSAKVSYCPTLPARSSSAWAISFQSGGTKAAQALRRV